jgi:hypothetical protein
MIWQSCVPFRLVVGEEAAGCQPAAVAAVECHQEAAVEVAAEHRSRPVVAAMVPVAAAMALLLAAAVAMGLLLLLRLRAPRVLGRQVVDRHCNLLHSRRRRLDRHGSPMELVLQVLQVLQVVHVATELELQSDRVAKEQLHAHRRLHSRLLDSLPQM